MRDMRVLIFVLYFPCSWPLAQLSGLNVAKALNPSKVLKPLVLLYHFFPYPHLISTDRMTKIILTFDKDHLTLLFIN